MDFAARGVAATTPRHYICSPTWIHLALAGRLLDAEMDSFVWNAPPSPSSKRPRGASFAGGLRHPEAAPPGHACAGNRVDSAPAFWTQPKANRIYSSTPPRASHDVQLWLLVLLAVVYSTVRFVEAYGLWHSRRWAEWFALIAGAIYMPVEIYELSRGVSPIKVGALAINVLIICTCIHASASGAFSLSLWPLASEP